MANETTTSTLAGAIANHVVPAVLEGYDELVLLPRVNVKNLGQGMGTTAQWPIMPRPSTANITEGSGVSNTAFTISSATATLGEHGILIAVTDKARTASTVTIAEIVANLMRRNAEAIDAKIVALFPAFQGGSGAVAAATTLTADEVLAAAGVLFAGVRGRMVNSHADLTLALNGEQYYSLQNDLQNNGTALAFTEVMSGVAQGKLTSVFGIPIVVTSQVVTGGSATNPDFVGALFHRDAMGAAVQRLPEVREEVKAAVGGGRGSLFQVSFVAGFTELVDSFGVPIESDTP